jgi:hypothetical protein
MRKTKPSALSRLREFEREVANAWVTELRELWGLQSPFNGEWIEPGEVYDFGDTLVLDIKTIRYIVTNDITYDQVQDWHEYVFWASENSFEQPSLRDYVEARVPLVSNDVQKRITDMRRDLYRLCDEERDRMRREQLNQKDKVRRSGGV